MVDIASLNKSLTQYTFTMRPRWKEHKVTRTRQNPYVVPPNKDIDSYVLLNDMYTLKSTNTQLRRLVQLVWGHDKNKRTLLYIINESSWGEKYTRLREFMLVLEMLKSTLYVETNVSPPPHTIAQPSPSHVLDLGCQSSSSNGLEKRAPKCLCLSSS